MGKRAGLVLKVSVRKSLRTNAFGLFRDPIGSAGVLMVGVGFSSFSFLFSKLHRIVDSKSNAVKTRHVRKSFEQLM